MPDRWAVATGNWSSTATWNGGTLPGTGDDVFADGFTVTIDQNVTVLSIRTTQRTGGTAGGGFANSTTRTITADMIAGTTTCLTISSTAASTVIGNVTGGSGTNAYGLTTTGTGTINCSGNVTGGSGSNAHGLRVTGAQTFNLIGNCLGGAGTGIGIDVVGTNSVVNITGNCTGSANQMGVRLSSAGVLTITGTCTAGSVAGATGVSNQSTGTVTIIGTCIGTVNSVGALNSLAGTLNALRAKGHTGTGVSGNTRFGIQNTSTGTCEVEEIEFGDLGSSPTGGAVSFKDLSTNKCIVYRVGLSPKTLVDPASVTIPRLSRGMDGGYIA